MKLQQKTIEKFRQLINEETEYRSGPSLVAFFNELGFNDSYGQGFPSRWAYTEDRLKAINSTKKMEECVKKIFAPVNFIGRFEELDKFITDFNQYLSFDGYKILRSGKTIRLITVDEDITPETNVSTTTEYEFLKKEFKEVPINKLKLNGAITDILEQRMEEIKQCLNSKSALATIFLCGSTLEGILLGIAISNPQKFNSATTSPKDKYGKVLQFHYWTLSDFINVAKEIGFLSEDVKKFSHSLRDFRNYIHPYQQVSQQFNPDEHTAKLCWQVLKVAIFQITKKQL
jgi:hypothetical protein